VTHVHTKIQCDGVALVRFKGVPREWAIGASTCPMNPSTEEGIREHCARHHPEREVESVRILPYVDWCEEPDTPDEA
jgi:hypothetical protein